MWTFAGRSYWVRGSIFHFVLILIALIQQYGKSASKANSVLRKLSPIVRVINSFARLQYTRLKVNELLLNKYAIFT